MTEAQRKDLFTEWALCGPIEQRLIIDEYAFVSVRETAARKGF